MGSALILVKPNPFSGTSAKVESYIPTWGETDAASFEKSLGDDTQSRYSFEEITHVSRPINGISVKPNTYAFVQVVKSDGSIVRVFNQLGITDGRVTEMNDGQFGGKAGAIAGMFSAEKKPKAASKAILDAGNEFAESSSSDEPAALAWTDWLLTSVVETRIEKTQLIETFGESYLYAFGERPRTLKFSGLLMNTADYNWRATFWENWNRFFRATQLIKANARIYIGWEDIIVEGYPLNAVAAQTSTDPNSMQFNFEFFVTNYTNLSAVRKFSVERRQKIAMVRSGLPSNPFDEVTLKDMRMSLIAFLGTPFANELGGLAHEAMLKQIDAAAKAGLGPAEVALRKEYAAFAARNVAAVTDAASKGLIRLGMSSAHALAFLTAFSLRVTHDFFSTVATTTKQLAEEKAGFKPGEVNAWFGFLGQIVDLTMDRAGIGHFAGSAGAYVIDAIRGGGFDVIIQALAYATISPMVGSAQEIKLTQAKPGGMGVMSYPDKLVV